MRVRLRWTDQNTVPHSTKIYRSDSEPLSNPTGSLLVTLTNGETVWDDTTVVRGATYWYTFAVTNAGDTKYSVPVQVTASPRTGPGPQELVWGDQDWGVYGVLADTSFITTTRLLATIGPGGLPNTFTNTWHKFCRKGKTLFVPRMSISFSITWAQLYRKGLVHGVAGPGPQNGGNADTEQRTTIQIGSDEFIVRLPTGFDDTNNPTRVTPEGVTLTNTGPYRKNSEVADLFWSPIYMFPVDRNKAMNGLNGLWYPPSSSGHYSNGNGPLIICQEIDPVARTTLVPPAFTSNVDMLPFTTSASHVVGSSNSNLGWFPILELIETMEVVL